MILAWWLFFGTLAATIGFLGLVALTDDDVWLIGAGVACLGAFCFLIAAPVISLERHYGRIGCRTFSAQTHRPTRFVIYTAWDGGDCLTPDGSGHWIPTKNLREFGQQP